MRSGRMDDLIARLSVSSGVEQKGDWLVAEGGITIDDVSCVATSFPTFFELLNQVAVR